MIAVDTNILVYARREELPKHEAALSALTRLAEGSTIWALPIFSVGEFVRVVSHPRLFRPATTPTEALQFVRALLASPSARLLLPTDAFLDSLERSLGDAGASGNLVFDAQIAALCEESGATTILTEDRDFLRFRKMKVVTLEELSTLGL